MSADTTADDKLIPEGSPVLDGVHYCGELPPLKPNTLFTDCRFESLWLEMKTLHGVKFLRCTFSEISFEDCTFDRTEWSECKLNDIRWVNCATSDAQIHESSLTNSSWAGGRIDGLNLTRVTGTNWSLDKLNSRHLAIVASETSRVLIRSSHLEDTSWMRGTIAHLRLLDCRLPNFIAGQLKSSHVSIDLCTGRNVRWVQCTTEHTKIQDCSFSQSAWSHSEISDAVIRHTTIETAGFDSSTLNRLEVTDSSMPGALFDSATLRHCTFRRFAASNASFRNARFEQVDLDGADLRRLDARGAVMTEVSLARVQCQHSNLAGQKRIDWRAADTTGSQFDAPSDPGESDWKREHQPGVRGEVID